MAGMQKVNVMLVTREVGADIIHAQLRVEIGDVPFVVEVSEYLPHLHSELVEALEKPEQGAHQDIWRSLIVGLAPEVSGFMAAWFEYGSGVSCAPADIDMALREITGNDCGLTPEMELRSAN